MPGAHLLESLKSAAQRGARGDLRLLLPGTTVSNLAFYASHSYYDELSSAGVKIYECQHALLHAKAVFIEGV